MIKGIQLLLRNNTRVLLAVFIAIDLLAISLVSFNYFNNLKNKTKSDATTLAKEIEGIKSTQVSELQVKLYRQLIERVGPVEAQEDLVHSGLPFDGQSHLINHTVGDWLYTKYGAKGLAYCKDYFLSSCYHGFLIKYISGEGISKLDKVMEDCWEVSLTNAYQCAHGIGHGLLAWDGYKNLPQALADCDRVDSLSPKFPLYNCYDGVFMENNWAVHNDGKPDPDRWVKASDPTFPCYDDRIAEKYRKACWSDQPQVMYKLFNGSIERVAEECKNIIAREYQDTCFDSLARQINPVAQGDPKKVFDLCNKVTVGWKNKCVNSNVSAFFSVGDRQLPFILCQMIPESGVKSCYEILQQRINTYTTDFKERMSLCAKVPVVFRSQSYCPST